MALNGINTFKGPPVITDICEKTKTHSFELLPLPPKQTFMFYIQDRYFLKIISIRIMYAGKSLKQVELMLFFWGGGGGGGEEAIVSEAKRRAQDMTQDYTPCMLHLQDKGCVQEVRTQL